MSRAVVPCCLLALPLAAPAAAEEPAADAAADLQVGLDTGWVPIAAFLVFFINASFAMFEAGLCRARNAVNRAVRAWCRPGRRMRKSFDLSRSGCRSRARGGASAAAVSLS